MFKYLIALLVISSTLHSQDVLLTINKTGTHWLIYSIHQLTGRPFKLNSLKKSAYKFSSRRDGLIHSHYGGKKRSSPSNKNRYLITIRNYKELITRNLASKKALYHSIEGTYEDYESLFLFISKCAPEQYHLIFYEDLIAEPKKTFQKLLAFLNASDEKLDTFIENLDYHRAESFKHYNHFHGKQPKEKKQGAQASDGESLIYHSKILSKREKVKIDEKFKSLMYFNEILARYAERAP
ncbi:MAG: sulfotransferase domain-containing protein [Simkaniaceae bacterium]|nr:sulfotransferase domain-containing protein [Simkaniaceae bacterium]